MIFESFVGRERELALLNARREETLRTRRGSIVSITGAPGIGKSRLLREFRAGSGRNVASGSARARDGASLPYGTWESLLAAITVPQRPALTTVLEKARESANPDAVASADERVAAIINALCTIARAAGGLSLVIDDVQFCDRASLEALHVLADRIEDHPIVLVLAMRNLDSSRDLSRVTALARIERLAETHIRLLPLADEHLAPILALSLPPESIAPVLQLAEGFPFAAEELGRAAATRSSLSEGIPLSLSGAILERLERLPAIAREIIIRAAVLGRDFALEDLAHVVDASEADVLAALRSARDEQLIAEHTDSASGTFRFRHALTREALYRTLLRVEATRLHTAVADRLEAHAPDRIAEIAFHRWSAADAVRAPGACAAAGQRALTLGAPSDAIEQFIRALSFDPLEAEFIARVGTEASRLCRMLFREEEAYAIARAARLRVDPARGPFAAFNLLLQEAQQAARILKYDETERLFNSAEQILDEVPASLAERDARAALAESRAIVAISQGRHAGAREQFALATSLDTTIGRSDVLEVIRALLLFEDGKIDASLATFEHFLANETRPKNLAVGALKLAYAHWYLGRLGDARVAAVRMGQIARQHGLHGVVPTANAFVHLIDATQGQFGDALDHLATQPPVEPTTRLILPTLRANLSTWTGRAENAHLVRDLETIGPSHVNATLFAGAMIWLYNADAGTAGATIVRFLSSRDRYAFDFEDAAIAFGDANTARERIERLELLAQNPDHRAAHAYARLGRARLAERAAQSIEAARCGREAASAFAALNFPIQRARAAWIARDYDEASDVLTRLGATAELARLRGETVEAKAASKNTLSRREEQVARAAASGASVKEIALDLGIGARTVETHLQNAYAKLNIRTRLELARCFAD